MNVKLGSLRNLEAFIDDGGHISIGPVEPFECVATAADESNFLAMLVRRKGETLQAFFARLDAAIALASSESIFTDEVNEAPRRSR